MEERRKIEQIPIFDEDGRVEYYKILNYKRHKNFLTRNEITFLKEALKIIKEHNQKNKNSYLMIFSQVAINRIIDINNLREKNNLIQEINNKSIDFVIYDIIIELDGDEHENNLERKNRDLLIDKMFKDVVKLIHIKNKQVYNKDEIIEILKEVV